MDLSKAKIYLDKINREFARMSKDPENIVRIDVDIMQSYIRDLYDAVLYNPEQKIVAPPTKQEVYVAPPVVRKSVEFTPERPAPPPPPVQTSPTPVYEPPAAAPPPVVAPPQPAAPPPPPVREPEPVAPPALPPVEKHIPKPIVREPYSPTLEEIQAPKPAQNVPPPTFAYSEEAETLFEQKMARELSEKLAERPIEDLKKGIALNDKLLMTRELFGGNNQAFDDVLTALNACSGFEQAKSYLVQHCVNRFDWIDKSRSERAKEFIRLVRRRYK